MNNDKDQPASSFPNFGMPLGGDMLEKTWEMMRATPFSAMLGAFGGPTSSVPKMVTPLTNPEELDRRITDLRAVEQWLKLNLHMLQSTIQGFEVQRATLATLQAFGAFAQSSVAGMTQPTPPAGSPRTAADKPAATTAAAGSAKPAAAPAEAAHAAAPMAFDPADWWNLLQAQLQQIAQFANASAAPAAAAKPSTQAGAASTDSDTPPAAAKKADPGGADLRRPAPRKTAKKAVPPASTAAGKR